MWLSILLSPLSKAKTSYEIYLGVLKQWAGFEYFDFATSIGLRKVLDENGPFSLIGPGVLYTYKVNKRSLFSLGAAQN